MFSTLQPCINPAGDVFHAGESVVEQELDGFCGAHAGLAMHKDVLIARQAFQLPFERSEGNQAGLGDIGDGVFLWFADIDEDAFEVVA